MALQINLTHLNFSYSGAIKILNDVNLSLNPGWTSIVGANGSGKTTLLKILAGKLGVESDSIKHVPDDMLINYCAQSVEEIDNSIMQFAESWERKSLRLQGKLDLVPEQIPRWDLLSPGERKRWQIGAALAQSPDLLLLDEPTNHLDFVARDLLMNVLKSYQGIGIIVSHDRDFIDNLCDSTIKIIPGGQVDIYSGNYSSAQEQWINEENLLIEKKHKLVSEEKNLKKRLDSTRRSQQKAQADQSPRHRMKSIKDHDARSMAKKGRAINAEQKLGKSTGVIRHKLEKTSSEVEGIFIRKKLGRSLFVMEDTSPKSELVSLKQNELQAGDKILIHDIDLQIKRDDRIRLHGKNGCGKTTLISKIIENSLLPEDKILFLPQEISTEESLELMEEIRVLPGDIKGRLMQIVAALGVSPDRLMSSKLPSPGEIRKLKLAKGLSLQAWLLILDEPTNHLDISSIERLETALVNYNGAILLVSHDERFAIQVCNRTWMIENNMISQW